MKYLKLYNESIKDYLKPKSDDKIINIINNMTSYDDKIYNIIKYKLFYLYSKEQLISLFNRCNIDIKHDILIRYSSKTHFTKKWKDKTLTSGTIFNMDETECEEFFKNVMIIDFYKYQ